MHFFTIHATPDPESEHAETAGGAYANCWIDFKQRDGAEVLARYYIEESDWIPDTIEEEDWVEEADYADDPEVLSYFQEAKEDGMCIVFHVYPIGEEEEDEEDNGEEWEEE
ncbi:hypothetical protein C7B61_18955 [filamentous cyanobacterium CCP1]|nr:hypothetical protein C7B76_14870 [filamentous cyanobacterium CCP2]PSB59198.1 hypothetical protein C7B61_18955 [filamentous cyanobacterium CCP1]